MAVAGTIAIDGGGTSEFTFTKGSITGVTVFAADNHQINIGKCTPNSLKLGGAVQNWTSVGMNEDSTAPGQIALQIDVATGSNSSTTLVVPGAGAPQHVNASSNVRLIFINRAASPPGPNFQGGIGERFDVKREQLK